MEKSKVQLQARLAADVQMCGVGRSAPLTLLSTREALFSIGLSPAGGKGGPRTFGLESPSLATPTKQVTVCSKTSKMESHWSGLGHIPIPEPIPVI